LLVPAVFHAMLDALNRRSCLVLMHGFNNADSEAAGAYFGFRARQTEINEPRTPLDGYFGDAFWPGDVSWWGWLDKADAIVYPIAVGTARRAANEVARLLWRMPRLQSVSFVAHSLGSRVVMETLLLLRQRALPRVERVCLMAAAVPSEMLEPGGRFFDLLRQMQADRTRFYVLHSMQDVVLHGAFPLGQRFAGADEASSRALGRFGPTPMMPGFGDTLRDDTVEGAGHGDYWGQVPGPASQKATELAGMFLELGARDRALATPRSVGVRRLR
jgi:pimeloyl-ACP methyl ester carboxylesterase